MRLLFWTVVLASSAAWADGFKPIGEVARGGPAFDEHCVLSSRTQLCEMHDGEWRGVVDDTLVAIRTEASSVRQVVPGLFEAEWVPVPEGLLVTLKGYSKYLVLECGEGTGVACPGRANFAGQERHDLDLYCNLQHCRHVRYWHRRQDSNKPVPIVPLVMALFFA